MPGWRFLLLLALLTIAGAARADCEAARFVPAAVRTVLQDGKVVATDSVTLPDRLPRAWRGPAVRLHYRLTVATCSAAQGRHLLLLSRVGAPYRISGDGRPLEPFRQEGYADGPPYNGRIGGMFFLAPGTREVEVEFVTQPNVAGGLIRVAEGPQADMLHGPARAWLRWQFFNQAVQIVLAAAGVLGLVLSLARSTRQATLWFSGACILWTLRGQLLSLFTVPLAPLVYEQMNTLLMGWSALLVCGSTLQLVGALAPRRTRALAAATVGLLLLFAASLAWQPLLTPFRTLVFVGSFALLVAMVVVLLRRRGDRGLRYRTWLAAGYICVLAGGVHDLGTVAGLLPPSWWTLLTPGFTILLLTHTLAVTVYTLRSLRRAEQANQELERAISAKARELQDSYQARQSLELAHAGASARAQERERLLRDMHDGLGAQLMTALRGVERGALGQQQLAQSLQDSLEELRLLMDSTDSSDYLPGALAAWRNRWDHRLQAAGVTLEWRIGEGLDDVHLPREATLQVMRILQEAATNILKHAQAQRMVLEASVAGGVLCIAIRDDGIGLAAQAPRPGARGLRNMQHRAAQIGAQLHVHPRAPAAGTEVLLQVPVPSGGA